MAPPHSPADARGAFSYVSKTRRLVKGQTFTPGAQNTAE